MEKTKIESRETGEIIEVYSRKAILDLIENLEEKEILEKAWKGYEKGSKSGSAIINLKTGELLTDSTSNNEHQEGEYITLYTFDKNFDVGDLDLIVLEDENEENVLFECIIHSGVVIDKFELEYQLNFIYDDEE